MYIDFNEFKAHLKDSLCSNCMLVLNFSIFSGKNEGYNSVLPLRHQSLYINNAIVKHFAVRFLITTKYNYWSIFWFLCCKHREKPMLNKEVSSAIAVCRCE